MWRDPQSKGLSKQNDMKLLLERCSTLDFDALTKLKKMTRDPYGQDKMVARIACLVDEAMFSAHSEVCGEGAPVIEQEVFLGWLRGCHDLMVSMKASPPSI